MALIGLLMFTSATSFLVGLCSRKRHQLIRVHHRAGSVEAGSGSDAAPGTVLGCSLASAAAPVTAITGPDGLIQPYVAGRGMPGWPGDAAACCKVHVAQGTATAIFRRCSKQWPLEHSLYDRAVK